MTVKGLIISILVLFGLCPLAHADGVNFGSLGDMKQGVGGRAGGMGGACVAAADDVTSSFWNPAGLSGMELYTHNFGFEHAFLPHQLSESYIGYAFHVPQLGNYAIAWMNYSAGGFEGRDAQGNETGDFGSSENIFFLSYGGKFYSLLKGLSLGMSLKLLYYGLGNFTAVGHGLDVGAQWQPILDWDHTVGISVQNLMQRVYWNGNSSNPSQVTVKAGVALRFFRSEDALYFNHLVSEVDVEFSENHRFNFRTGVEYWYWRELAIRAGYTGNQFTVGATYAPQFYSLDYCFRYDPSELANNQHLISIMIRLK